MAFLFSVPVRVQIHMGPRWIDRKQTDFALTWVKPYGKGRAFITIQSKSPRISFLRPFGSMLRCLAIAVNFSPSVLRRTLGLGGSVSLIIRWISDRDFTPLWRSMYCTLFPSGATTMVR
jgi:hypothetical protein